MFVDHAVIFCFAGSGGNGCNAYTPGRNVHHLRAVGGDAGQGGSIIVEAHADVRTLLDVQMKKTFKALHGKHGGPSNMTGKVADDMIIRVPAGTQVFEEPEGYLLADLVNVGDRVTAAKGGAGGKGNHRHADATRGDAGEEKTIRLELKVLADVGIVGCPNAGKSTFISHVSNAKSRVAAFPFTTKTPVLGVISDGDGGSIVLADIPGLIEGAHEGRGLGHQFLRHIERTRLFLHLVDMAGVDGRDPLDDYRVIRKELASYLPDFKKRPFIIAANKMDVPEAKVNLAKFKKKVKVPIYPISAATGEGLQKLKMEIFNRVGKLTV
jgi:GTP-binding protein